MIRDESGTTLPELLVVLVISGMLLSGMIGMVYATVRLLNAAPTDTNPHTYGAVATAVARLETRATGQQSCNNPTGEPTRTDCLDVRTNPAMPLPATQPGGVCWVVTIDDPDDPDADRRRLECWELQPATGELVAHRYTHNETDNDAKLLPPEQVRDLLTIDDWGTVPAETLPLASGLAAAAWTGPQLAPCAAIRPDQRPTLDTIPLCDGNEVSRFAQPEPQPGEGYPMPPLLVEP